jgi:aspartyl-tRNA(Asn)/glutamyl-tRNA(Gln) amidotransferase subunit B
MTDVKLSPKSLAETIQLIKNDVISSKIAKELLPLLLEGEAEGQGVAALVEERGMGQISDEGKIRELIQDAMNANPKQLEQFRYDSCITIARCSIATGRPGGYLRPSIRIFLLALHT